MKRLENPVTIEINGQTCFVEELWDTMYSINGEMSLGHGGNDLAIYISDGCTATPCGGKKYNCDCIFCDNVRSALWS